MRTKPPRMVSEGTGEQIDKMQEERGFKKLPIEDIKAGSIWMAADGANHGKIVIGYDWKTKELLVTSFVVCKNKVIPCTKWTSIDYFKLQYRYCLQEPQDI